jgi:TRAP-type mannitol/chloroaromatic compound transport system permease small subunit
MRFIVDIYGYIIFAFCGLLIISAVLLVLFVATSGANPDMTAGTIIGPIAALLFLVLNLGGIAIIVSLHDRHAELVDEARQLNATMGELVYTLTHQRAGREAVQ